MSLPYITVSILINFHTYKHIDYSNMSALVSACTRECVYDNNYAQNMISLHLTAESVFYRGTVIYALCYKIYKTKAATSQMRCQTTVSLCFLLLKKMIHAYSAALSEASGGSTVKTCLKW